MAERQSQYELVFNHFDGNGDGKLSPAELQRGVTSLGGELSLAEAEAVVAWSDADGDKLLDLDEFVRFVNVEEEAERVAVLREAFNVYKIDDGSERITADSLKRMLGRLGERRSVEECTVMLSKFDLDGDGVLDFDEFKVMMS
uniref:EF-hand domain-containing protein n=1 Tax=Kalanchoe fedtschenkoi TaxID=63787 RepID=A0A7N1A316_KALFE